VTVVEDVDNAGTDLNPAMHVAVSSTGTLIYVARPAPIVTPLTKLVQMTLDGTKSPLADITGMAWFSRFSPDGSRVAYHRRDRLQPPLQYPSSELNRIIVGRTIRTNSPGK
jgi:hypothetical protein